MPTLNVVVSAKLFQFIVSSLLAVVQVVCFGPLNAAANAGPLTNEMRQKLVTMMTKEYEYMIGSNDGTSDDCGGVVTAPLARFLCYASPGGELPVHVDLARTWGGGLRSTHSL